MYSYFIKTSHIYISIHLVLLLLHKHITYLQQYSPRCTLTSYKHHISTEVFTSFYSYFIKTSHIYSSIHLVLLLLHTNISYLQQYSPRFTLTSYNTSHIYSSIHLASLLLHTNITYLQQYSPGFTLTSYNTSHIYSSIHLVLLLLHTNITYLQQYSPGFTLTS